MSGDNTPQPGDGVRRRPGQRAVIIAASLAGLVWVLAARMLGPSDVWDQTQPRTVSYTTDIIVTGGHHWILPDQPGGKPATKPPLYNWLAVPAVRAMGFASELAHKLPSVVALCACWLYLVALGQRIFRRRRDDLAGSADRATPGRATRAQPLAIGWLAGLMFVSSYTMFKLGYLARPDMLLTLWLMLGWTSATATFADEVRSRPVTPLRRTVLALIFWLSVGLAGLTKGPVLVVPLLYAAVAARMISGRWRAINRLQWWWGLPVGLGFIGAWLLSVWRIDPEHLRTELWFNEFAGRITGLGPEGNPEGPGHALDRWVRSLGYMPVYFLLRFLPWSVLAVLAMVKLWRRRGRGGARLWRALPGVEGLWLQGAALLVVIVVLFFSLSAGKRADYIAGAYAPAALLAAWWWTNGGVARLRWLPHAAPLAAVVALVAMTWVNEVEPAAPYRGFGGTVSGFITEAARRIEADPAPVTLRGAGQAHLPAFFGVTDQNGGAATEALLLGNKPFWVVAGGGGGLNPGLEFDRWLARRSERHTAEIRWRTELREPVPGWPGHLTLWRVEPVARSSSSPGPRRAGVSAASRGGAESPISG